MNQERRQYFRINGKVALDYKIITIQEMKHSRLPSQFEVSPFFMLLTELQDLSQDSSYQLRKISQKEPAIASYLENLGARINAVAQAVAKSDVEFDNLSTHEINLSEGGLSFSNDVAIELGSYLALKIVFEENLTGLLLYGRVLYCGLADEKGYKIGVEFTDMPESSRMIVARHILSCQARDLQKQDNDN
ncbi:PilZ domain-containing protein [Amphritea balenae]|uniref:PilZ domain-containing protein n=1 Tax=Amphritea balenae TaxID=452629 RepID=A0A3P1STX6_9GAMM|nr:PilZ domain-containing protein [Amphritea balenae]RRD00664.1 PilZ domain-containing protein [Amphritea balenae]GGK68910.1 hypothetical protein GCM10007941_18810 [Amphritea balenae]